MGCGHGGHSEWLEAKFNIWVGHNCEAPVDQAIKNLALEVLRIVKREIIPSVWRSLQIDLPYQVDFVLHFNTHILVFEHLAYILRPSNICRFGVVFSMYLSIWFT